MRFPASSGRSLRRPAGAAVPSSPRAGAAGHPDGGNMAMISAAAAAMTAAALT